MRKISLLVMCFFAIAFNANAQNSDNKWAVDYSYSGLDFSPWVQRDNWFLTDNWNNGGKVGVAYSLNPFINLTGEVGLHTLNKQNLNMSTSASSLASIYSTVGAQFRLANGAVLPESFILDPYLYVGAGVHFIEDKPKGLLTAGGGLNIWLKENVAVVATLGYQFLPNENFTNYQKSLQHTIGLKFRWGAKDTDGDGIVDKEDACPTEAGEVALQGCPDKDKDGIKDSEDECPDVAGLKDLKGCPDADNDGIKDSDDACPNEAGKPELKGCPDKDGDGIADKDDACPDVAGVASLQGCPDKDGDGIKDSDDECPEQAGTAEFKGCPDTDGDGIRDKDDKCPNEKGVAARQGCPEPKVEAVEIKKVEEKLKMSAQRIQFQTGSAIILKQSNTELDKVVDIMKQYPGSNFSIEGHTDNVGNAAANKKLSQDRANAVRKYFTDKGIDESRLKATGYGAEKPIKPNTTVAGQAANRRVEIHLSE